MSFPDHSKILIEEDKWIILNEKLRCCAQKKKAFNSVFENNKAEMNKTKQRVDR